jgi:hypothetical protein
MSNDLTPTPPSPALQFLTVLWEHHCEAVPHSWRTVNESMRRGLHLAIEAGLQFAREDFATIHATMRLGYWAGSDNEKNMGEQFYCVAIAVGNRSACLSFEAWKGRKPFIVQGKRLGLRSVLPWDGRETVVTSFDDDAQMITVCAYATMRRYTTGPRRWVQGDGAPLKRYTLTHADLRRATTTRRGSGRLAG